MEEPQESDLLTVDEVATKLRVNPSTIRRWIKRGVLDAVILPHLHKRESYRIKKSTLAKLLR